MPYGADRCMETTTTTGTGSLTLGGAASQFQSFASAFPNAPMVVEYAIVGQTGTEWEVGEGVFTSPSTLTRATIRASSNAGAVVNLSSGTKDVFSTYPAGHARKSNSGNIHAHALGWALP
jgi:hypothetical protein